MKSIKYLMLASCWLLAACTDETQVDVQLEEGTEMALKGNIQQVYTSRVNDSGFADGDPIGVFVVDYENGVQQPLAPKGNNADNVRFVYDEQSDKWQGDEALFWKDGNTPVDVYGYYPYDDRLTEVVRYPFAVQTDQRATVGKRNVPAYEMSDFLWAKTEKVYAETKTVNLLHKHLMANVQVSLEMGGGFEEAEWKALEKSVVLEGTITQAQIHLGTGEVSPVSSAKAGRIIPSTHGDRYFAIAVPQTLPANTPLLTIQVGETKYVYQRNEETIYYPGKSHRFTLLVSKSDSEGNYQFKALPMGITQWVSDPVSHNGSAKAYVVVDVPERGMLEEVMKAKFKAPSSIKNLKIKGKIDGRDLYWISRNLSRLEAINLADVPIQIIPSKAFEGMQTLRHVVFPKTLKHIENDAFMGVPLSGSLVIPEGVETIKARAFSGQFGSNFSGELVLPSTLTYIGQEAFWGATFTGQLRLPENLETIERLAFSSCRGFSGPLVIPNHVKFIGGYAFAGMSNVSGVLMLPESLETIECGAFSGLSITGVHFNKGLLEIGDKVFWGTTLMGDLFLPEGLRHIGNDAFRGTLINSVYFPQSLKTIGRASFCECELRDTLHFPPSVEEIPKYAFGDNKFLQHVVIPEGTKKIGGEALSRCFNIQTITCKPTEPPVLADHYALGGVSVDKTQILVPEESVGLYRNAPYWETFSRITAHPNTYTFPSFYKMLNAGGKRNFTLYTRGKWKVIHCPDWCHLSVTSGFKKTPIELVVDASVQGSGLRKDSIVFASVDRPEVVTSLNIKQYDYEHQEDEVVLLQKATRGKGVDIFFVGDGYDAEDIVNGKYMRQIQREVEYFFAVEPYTTYKDYFNVYTSYALSNESGIGTVHRVTDVKFGTRYGDGKAENRIITNAKSAVDYMFATIPSLSPSTVCVIAANGELYDGVTYMGYGAVSVCPTIVDDYSDVARGIVQHEAGGHGFGKLGDEYIYHGNSIIGCLCHCCPHVDEFLGGKKLGWFANLSLNGDYKRVEWREFIMDSRFTEDVDIFEGGYFHGMGIFRPEENSCMNDNVPYFNAPSRMEIVRRILEQAGEEFTFEKFASLDSNKPGKEYPKTDIPSPQSRASHPTHLAPPVLLDENVIKTK